MCMQYFSSLMKMHEETLVALVYYAVKFKRNSMLSIALNVTLSSDNKHYVQHLKQFPA